MAKTKEPILHIDFETGSAADLRKVGAAKYAENPTTRVICTAFTTPWRPEEKQTILCFDGHNLPDEFWRWIEEGKPVAAWNASFEFYIWNKVMSPFFGPEIKPEQLHDTMAQAAYWGLPLSLDQAGEALPELGIVKDKQGQALMKRMARPRGTDPVTGELRWWDQEDPARLKLLEDYCKQDVRVEKAIHDYLPPLPERERKIWLMDFRANDRGIPLDFDLAHNMTVIAKSEQTRLDRELSSITDGEVTSTTKATALRDWCADKGLATTSLSKDLLPGLVDTAESSGLFLVAEALSLRQEAAKSSVAKVNKMLDYACKDGRMRGLTQYYGAFRTGRWAGRGPQVQNFPRGEVKDTEALVNFIRSKEAILDPGMSDYHFGVKPLTALSSALRGCLWIPDGEGEFASIDFSQIEARVLAWLAGSKKILESYENGLDLYRVAAADIYGVKYGDIGDPSEERQVGKVSVLALGYQGGVGAYQTMAKVYGLEIPDERADQIKTAWREKNPEIVSYWYDIDQAAIDAVREPGTITRVTRMTGVDLKDQVTIEFAMALRGTALLCKLPSGRTLCYREPRIAQNQFGKDCVTYMGVDQYTRKWTRLDTYGGKLVENVTQAVARDIMADALLWIEDCVPEAEILGSVHDEVLLRLLPLKHPFGVVFDLAKSGMLMPIDWAEGLPLDADGYHGRRFKK